MPELTNEMMEPALMVTGKLFIMLKFTWPLSSVRLSTKSVVSMGKEPALVMVIGTGLDTGSPELRPISSAQTEKSNVLLFKFVRLTGLMSPLSSGSSQFPETGKSLYLSFVQLQLNSIMLLNRSARDRDFVFIQERLEAVSFFCFYKCKVKSALKNGKYPIAGIFVFVDCYRDIIVI